MERLIDKSAVRRMGNGRINAINVRGVLVHPECRTDEECQMAVSFHSVTNGICPRCLVQLIEPPTRAGTLAARVRSLRTERGWSQETFGHRCDLHPTIISKLERRKRGVTFAVLLKMAKGCGMTLSEFLEGVERQ